MKSHKLKIKPEYLDDILSGKKKFEIRRNDRDYIVGDICVLSDKGMFRDVTKLCKQQVRSVSIEIIHTSDYEQKRGFIVFGFNIIADSYREMMGKI